MFSAILGLLSGVGSLFGAVSSYNMGMSQLAQQQEAIRQQKIMADRQFGLGLDQLRRERELEDYLRQINDRNYRAQLEDAATIKTQSAQRLAQYQRERQYEIDRQLQIDKDAAKTQAFRLEQLLRTQRISASERADALKALNEAKAIAAGERDEDLRRFAEERAMAAAERDFAISELRTAQSNALFERQDDISMRNRIMGRLDSLSSELRRAYSTLPELTPPSLLGRPEIEAEVARQERAAERSVDRATDRVASINEGELIARGIDSSSVGTARRADIASRMATEYENARIAARNSATAYISGINDNLLKGYESVRDARSSAFSEILGLYAPELEGLSRIPAVRSANAYDAPVPISSGIYTRPTSSANSYSAPLPVTSAAVTGDIGSSIGDYLRPTSTADAYRFDLASRQQQPQTWNITSPAGFFQASQSAYNSIPNQYDWKSFVDMAMRQAGGGFGAIGSSLSDMQKAGWFSGSSTPTPVMAGQNGVPPVPTPRPYNPVGIPPNPQAPQWWWSHQ